MCGICGFWEFGGPRPGHRARVEAMNGTLAHRGPDEAGALVAGGAAIAMSRLAIIDLACGQQPLSGDGGRLSIVYNGEAYNFAELRRELQGRGHRFATRSDTEVVLTAYQEWGPEAVSRLRGMFAFCVAHTAGGGAATERLFLARDRVGKKPLFYYHDGARFVFGSEIKALLAHPGVPRRMDRRMLPLYLAHGYVPAPYTMFEGIRELPPGHTLVVEADGRVQVQRYWDGWLPPPRPAAIGEAEAAERLRVLLEDAVRVRMVSDVPLGAFLSGGLDSTAVVAYMARHSGRPVKTFAIGFEGDPTFNELEHARRAARAFGTEHHEFVVTPDALDLLPLLVKHHDQPFADSSALPTYLVSRLTREHVTVALTGDGGDELFAGYERFAAARMAERYRRAPAPLRAALEAALRALPESTGYRGFVRRARRFVESAPLPLAERYLGWVGIFSPASIREMLAGEPQGAADPASHFAGYFAPAAHADLIGQLLYVNAHTYLPGDLLVKTDRMTMAASLEARSPFLDHTLIEFAASLPSALKLKGGTTKHLLKRAMEGVVPREIIHRRKHGFGVPLGRWFRGELAGYLRETLLSPVALGRGYFRPEIVRRLVDEHQGGRRDHAHRLWALLTLELWHRAYLDGR
ncbi:MAG TPA: asparagine synthase (glutamine-hydrolyzing) [Longimicrobium sp.]|jgi:asparagine synthase (glutamine-hydrolysing)|uniref:asparagine synthase (glutamine-hydrolyzing) n=1 Tax=Longimicrobium sp. TaxID=2029185 RepID=UPI002ED963E4